MISKKMRNISMVCLSLVLALTLAFGLSSFSVKKASAAEISAVASSVDFSDTSVFTSYTGTAGSETSISSLDGYAFFQAKSSAALKLATKSSVQYMYVKLAAIRFKVENCASITIQYYVNSTSSTNLVVSYIGTEDAALTDSTYKSGYASSAQTFTTKTKDMQTVTYNVESGEETGFYKIVSETSSREVYIKSITFTSAVTNYTVSFDTVGGSDVAAETVEEGKTLTAAPTAPTKTGYNFLGWSTDGLTVIDDITTVTINSDTTFKAVWELDANFVKPSITEYDVVSNVEIDFGTAIDAIELPAEVTSGEHSFPVTWTWDKDYDATVLQNYTLTGNVEVDADVYDVTAVAPTMQVIVKEIAVASQTLEGTYYTFDNANVLGLPTTIAVSGVDFEISWNAYVADSAAITGSLVAKTGYDVSNATVTANVELVSSAKSINFGAMGTSADEQVAVDQFSGEGYTLNSNTATTLDAGSADQTQYRGLKIKNSDVVLTFFVKGEANVSFAIGSGSFTFTYTDVNGKNQTATADGGTPGQAYSYLVKDSKCTLQRNGSSTSVIKYINIDDGNSTTYSAFGENNQLPTTAAAKEGYEFIGWQYNNNLVAPNAVVEPTTPTGNTDCYGDIYTAVYAKAEYLGMSFRKSAESPAVRFGYVVNIVDASENALNGLNLNASAVFNVANLTKGSSANVNFDALSIAYNENKGGYLANLAITGIDSAKAQNALNVDMTITINGVSITAESNATESDTIVSAAQILYDAGQLTDAQAEIYGVVLNG